MKWSCKIDPVQGRYKVIATNGMYRAVWDLSFAQLKNRKYVRDMKNALRLKVGG